MYGFLSHSPRTTLMLLKSGVIAVAVLTTIAAMTYAEGLLPHMSWSQREG